MGESAENSLAAAVKNIYTVGDVGDALLRTWVNCVSHVQNNQSHDENL